MALAKAPAPPIQLIRLALVAGVLLFGAVIVIVQRQPGWTPSSLPSALGFGLLAYALFAIAIISVMRRRIARESDPQRRGSLVLAASAVGEAAGLFGGVLFLLTGQSQWYLIGLAAMAISFALLGVRISGLSSESIGRSDRGRLHKDG